MISNLSVLPKELQQAQEEICSKAKEYGLDFFPIIFELCTYEQMNMIASYGGFPQRYPHWRFGAEYEGMKKRHHYGLGRIYEMIINSNPCYAYLQESNSLVDQKLVMSHCFGHSHFFKNNLWFSQTNRRMMDGMANHATKVRKHVEKQGYDVVEQFIDTCLSLEHLIDPYNVFMNRGPMEMPREEPKREEQSGKFQAKDYMDRWINPAEVIEKENKKLKDEKAQFRFATPAKPTMDVLKYLLENAQLDEWQIDILEIIRDEAYYFAPQGMTKIMNEGLAVLTHSKLMTEHFVDASEIIDYADHHSGVLYMQPGGFNPYKIGVELLRDIEDRWNTGKFGTEYEEAAKNLGGQRNWDKKLGKGMEKVFEVTRIYNDVGFIDEFMTPEFIEKHKYYQYGRDQNTGKLHVISRDPVRIKQTLLHHLTNMGRPFIYVVDGNYKNARELYLAHKHIGLDIEIKFATDTLKNMFKVWRRTVHLQAKIDDKMMLFSFDGNEKNVKSQEISEALPKPAHTI